jgi:hypothetical protein
MVSVQRVYLVISPGKDVRVAKRPRVGPHEVAVAINLTFPDSWGQIIGTLSVDVPDFAPVTIEGDAA